MLTVGEGNKVKRVVVQTGARGEGLVTLVKGPPAGTRVIQNAAAFLLDGDVVKPMDATAAPAAAPAAKPAAASVPGKKQ